MVLAGKIAAGRRTSWSWREKQLALVQEKVGTGVRKKLALAPEYVGADVRKSWQCRKKKLALTGEKYSEKQ